jgi:hypothetical protein
VPVPRWLLLHVNNNQLCRPAGGAASVPLSPHKTTNPTFYSQLFARARAGNEWYGLLL